MPECRHIRIVIHLAAIQRHSILFIIKFQPILDLPSLRQTCSIKEKKTNSRMWKTLKSAAMKVIISVIVMSRDAHVNTQNKTHFATHKIIRRLEKFSQRKFKLNGSKLEVVWWRWLRVLQWWQNKENSFAPFVMFFLASSNSLLRRAMANTILLSQWQMFVFLFFLLPNTHQIQ